MNGIQGNTYGSTNVGVETSSPSIAIVILNWNGRKFLEQFLPSVMASTYINKRIIVADNASTDNSVAFLQTHFTSVEIIQNEANEGYAKGYNTALKRIKSDYYVLLNSDVEVTPGWIEPIISLMESDVLIAACQPKLLAYNNKLQFEYAGASGGWIDSFGYPFTRGRIFDHCEMDKGQYDSVQPCFWASGAALFVKSKIYHEMGGLDEYFFAHQEEIDFCWRLHLAGFKVFVQPSSVVYHLGGGTLPKGNSRKTFLNFRNNLIMLYKNLPWQIALWKIPLRLMLDIMAAWKHLLDGDSGFFLSIAKAHLQFARWIFFEKHNYSPSKSTEILFPGMYTGSIVWDHFVKKKTSFLEIVGNK